MDISVFLGEVLGFYLVIMSLFLLLRYEEVKPLLREIIDKPAIILFYAFFTIVLGLFLVFLHNIWVLDWRVIVTILSYLILLGGIFRLFFPDRAAQASRWWLQHPQYIMAAGVVYLLVGVFLIYFASTF